MPASTPTSGERVATSTPTLLTRKSMTTICAWCQRRRMPHGEWIEDVAGVTSDDPTHGICPECAREVRGQIQTGLLDLDRASE